MKSNKITYNTSNTQVMSNTPIILCLIFIYPIGVYLILQHRPHWFKKVWLIILITLHALLWSIGLVSVFDNSLHIINNSTKHEEQAVKTKIVFETAPIPFKEERIDDQSINENEKIIERDGVDGEKVITYEVKTNGGIEISRITIKEEITREPINKIIKMRGAK